MPQLFPILIAAIGSAASAIGAAAAAIAGALGISTGSLILFGVGIGLSLLSSLLFRPPQPKPSDVQINYRQSTAFRFFALGRVKVGGLLVFVEQQGGYLHRVIAMGHGKIDAVEEQWVDQNVVTLDGSFNAVGDPYFMAGKTRLHIEYRLGEDDQPHYEVLAAAFPDDWTEDHQGNGVPHAYVRMLQIKAELFGRLWPRGAETLYRQVQRGRLVFDPRASGHDIDDPETWAWSENAALHVLFLLISPDALGLSTEWVTNAIDDWIIAADICDEEVPLKAGGTEKRYRSGGVYRMDERPADMLARPLAACDGRLMPAPGRGLALKVGKWVAPTITLDADAIVGFSEVTRGRDILTTANTIRAQYMSPLHDYKETDADPWIDDDDVAERGEITANVEFLTVPSHAQCRRLMKIIAHRANPEWTATLTVNLRGLQVLGERFIRVTYAPFGIDHDFEIVGDIGFVLAEGSVLHGLTIPIASLSSAAYAWDATTEEGTAPEIPEDVEPDNTVPEPENFEVEVEQRTLGGGAVVSVAMLSWDEPGDDTLTSELQGQADTDDVWFAIAVTPETFTAEFLPLLEGVEYNFRVRFTTITGRVSEWVEAGPVVAVGAPVIETFSVTELATGYWRFLFTLDEPTPGWGVKIRYREGIWSSWADLNPLQTGVVTASPWLSPDPDVDDETIFTFGAIASNGVIDSGEPILVVVGSSLFEPNLDFSIPFNSQYLGL